jgi:hypothetical protein
LAVAALGLGRWYGNAGDQHRINPLGIAVEILENDPTTDWAHEKEIPVLDFKFPPVGQMQDERQKRFGSMCLSDFVDSHDSSPFFNRSTSAAPRSRLTRLLEPQKLD